MGSKNKDREQSDSKNAAPKASGKKPDRKKASGKGVAGSKNDTRKPDRPPAPGSPTVVEDRGFTRAQCPTCGWRGTGYRARESARREAADHRCA